MLPDNREKQIIEKNILDNRCFLSERQLIIFGCTRYAREVRDSLVRNDLKLYGIIDNNKDKVGKECLGKEVESPDEALLPLIHDVCVIICSKYNHEMSQQILNMGYTQKNLLIINVDDEISDTIDRLNESIDEVKKGLELYEKIIEQVEENTRLFLCPYPGTGDIYFECAYLPEYIRQNSISSYALVVVGNKCKKVCEIFGVTNTFVVEMSQMEDILKAWQFFGSDLIDAKPLLHWGWRCKRYLFSSNHPQITFNEMFVYDTFCFIDQPKRALPQKYKFTREVDDLFEKNKLKPGRTVVLAPYAGSFVSEMPITLWEEIALELRKRGYTVCTNCIGKEEYPIVGTTPISFSFAQAISFLDKAGGFIALRSGLCDIVSSSIAKQIIIYESSFSASDINYFGIKKMGLNDQAFDIEYSDEESFVKTILEQF